MNSGISITGKQVFIGYANRQELESDHSKYLFGSRGSQYFVGNCDMICNSTKDMMASCSSFYSVPSTIECDHLLESLVSTTVEPSYRVILSEASSVQSTMVREERYGTRMTPGIAFVSLNHQLAW
jgi:hypothetical protein